MTCVGALRVVESTGYGRLSDGIVHAPECAMAQLCTLEVTHCSKIAAC